MREKIVVVTGPTASGKTRLAIELAKKFNGEIISADSRQVYRGLDIGSGKDIEEYGQIPYHLVDVADQEEKFTLFDWLERSKKCIDETTKRGKLPIVAGGTGLYVEALVEGFEQVKSEKSKAKSKIYSREELDGKSLKELQKICSQLSIHDSTFDQRNPRRLIRAIERAQEGTVISKIKPDFEILQIAITLPRKELYEKIDKRVDSRFEDGMLEEVRGLLNQGVDPAWLNRLGLEYRIISEYIISGSSDFDKMAQDLKWKTHAYARRQMTWYRRFAEIRWVKNKNEAVELVDKFLET